MKYIYIQYIVYLSDPLAKNPQPKRYPRCFLGFHPLTVFHPAGIHPDSIEVKQMDLRRQETQNKKLFVNKETAKQGELYIEVWVKVNFLDDNLPKKWNDLWWSTQSLLLICSSFDQNFWISAPIVCREHLGGNVEAKLFPTYTTWINLTYTP